jgi:hypothetical protein
MIGTIKKDEGGNFIVVYHKECIEDSDAVVRVSCKLMPSYKYCKFEDDETIEFELLEFVQKDGSFDSYAKPYFDNFSRM